MSAQPPLTVPAAVIRSATGRDEIEENDIIDIVSCPLDGSSGASTEGLVRLSIRLATADGVEQLSLVRKDFQPLRSGRHAHGAHDPGHWSYWRRELLAYASGLLPQGPGLRAPRCHGVFGSTLYLEDAGGEPADFGGRPSCSARGRPRQVRRGSPG